jgi:glycosyltransferase involved in cell wall biosynthesis
LENSLLAQTIDDWEWLVVVDDLQINSYHALLSSYVGERVRILNTGKIQAGPSVARNIGLSAARGTILSCVDADDVYHPNRLLILGDLIEHYGVACDNHYVTQYETNHVLGQIMPIHAPHELCRLITLNQAMMFNLPFFPIFHRQYLDFWCEDIYFAEDVLFNLNLLQKSGGMCMTNEGLLNYRTHHTSLCNQMPEGYFRAKQGYQFILDKLEDVNYLNYWSIKDKTALYLMFKNKAEINDAFWLAYQAGKCKNFNEFQLLR